MGYDKRIVVFIDILGFKDAIEKSNTDEKEFERINETLKKLKIKFEERFLDKEALKHSIEMYDVNTDNQIIQVSDSLIYSVPIIEPGGFYLFLSKCFYAMQIILEGGFLCRGVITIGNLKHDGSLIFGDAFIRAYCEENKGGPPIIKFNEELLQEVKKYPRKFSSEEDELKFIIEECKQKAQPNSNEYYIDYFTDNDDSIKGRPEMGDQYYETLRTKINEGLEDATKDSILEKYNWLKEQYNIEIIKFYEKYNRGTVPIDKMI
jgi:hypothetical protein